MGMGHAKYGLRRLKRMKWQECTYGSASDIWTRLQAAASGGVGRPVRQQEIMGYGSRDWTKFADLGGHLKPFRLGLLPEQ